MHSTTTLGALALTVAAVSGQALYGTLEALENVPDAH